LRSGSGWKVPTAVSQKGHRWTTAPVVEDDYATLASTFVMESMATGSLHRKCSALFSPRRQGSRTAGERQIEAHDEPSLRRPRVAGLYQIPYRAPEFFRSRADPTASSSLPRGYVAKISAAETVTNPRTIFPVPLPADIPACAADQAARR
jgi:hypothetical protein